MDRIIAFVCLHGAGKSRIAAAMFNAAAPPGWHATSAGVQPQAQPSERAAVLLQGEPAAECLDRTPPRGLDDLRAEMIVAIDCDLPDALSWALAHEWPAPEVRDELRILVHDLAVELTGA